MSMKHNRRPVERTSARLSPLESSAGWNPLWNGRRLYGKCVVGRTLHFTVVCSSIHSYLPRLNPTAYKLPILRLSGSLPTKSFLESGIRARLRPAGAGRSFIQYANGYRFRIVPIRMSSKPQAVSRKCKLSREKSCRCSISKIGDLSPSSRVTHER
jgi:hypothetical protein